MPAGRFSSSLSDGGGALVPLFPLSGSRGGGPSRIGGGNVNGSRNQWKARGLGESGGSYRPDKWEAPDWLSADAN